MSEIAFDAAGEPVQLEDETEELLVRRFRNPGMRGACEKVYGRDGQPAYVRPSITFREFCKEVDFVSARYRLDQCDGSRRVIPNAPALYVSVTDGHRNAGAWSGGPEGPLYSVIHQLADANVRMSNSITDKFSAVMGAAANLINAANGAGLPRRRPPIEPPDDRDTQDDESARDPWVDVALQVLPLANAWVASKIPQPPPPAAAPAQGSTPTPRPEGPSGGTASASAAAGPSTPASDRTPDPAADGAAHSAAATPSTPPPASGGPRNAATPTPAQWAHLLAIRARLSPREAKIAETAVLRMTSEVRAQWLAELSAMTIEEGASVVRSMMPTMPARPPEAGEVPPAAPSPDPGKAP